MQIERHAHGAAELVHSLKGDTEWPKALDLHADAGGIDEERLLRSRHCVTRHDRLLYAPSQQACGVGAIQIAACGRIRVFSCTAVGGTFLLLSFC